MKARLGALRKKLEDFETRMDVLNGVSITTDAEIKYLSTCLAKLDWEMVQIQAIKERASQTWMSFST